MKKYTLPIIVLLILIAAGCGGNLNKEFVERFQKGPNGKEIPEPKFDIPTMDILNEFKAKYDPASVRLGRPFIYSNDQDLRYWIKVEFLNPEIGEKTVRDFEKEIATIIANHLTNPTDFDEIEVSVAQKKGFIITFSQSQNSFFKIDSLRTIKQD